MSLMSNLEARLIYGLLSNRSVLYRTPGFNFTATSHHFILKRTTMASSTSGDTGKLVVEHDPGKNKFCIKLGEAEAKLEYTEEKEKTGAKVLNMWHTEVPSQLQGRGIAKLLAKEAFEHVVQNKIKMRLSCSYLQKYFNDNPLDKYKAAVV